MLLGLAPPIPSLLTFPSAQFPRISFSPRSIPGNRRNLQNLRNLENPAKSEGCQSVIEEREGGGGREGGREGGGAGGGLER